MADQQQAADELDTLLTAIDTETNRLADEVRALAAGLPAAGGLNAKQAAGLKARLLEHEARLRGIAADADNPVPTGPVTVPPPPAASPPADGTGVLTQPLPDGFPPPPDAGTGDAAGAAGDAGGTAPGPAEARKAKGK